MLPDDVAALMRARRSEAVWLTELPPCSSFDDVAVAAGIRPLGRGWQEVGRPAAIRFLTAILRLDLAYYSVEKMPAHRATWLAGQFLDSVGPGARYAHNYDEDDIPGDDCVAFDPGTDFSFDAGIVALGPEGSALYWVADED